jgi:hypothetical protein
MFVNLNDRIEWFPLIVVLKIYALAVLSEDTFNAVTVAPEKSDSVLPFWWLTLW